MAEKVPGKNIPNNTILYVNTEILTDCCSIDFLQTDLFENLSAQDSNLLKRAYLENFPSDSSSLPIDFEPENRPNSESKNCNNETSNKKKKKKVKPVKSELSLSVEPSDSVKATKKPAAVKSSCPEEPVKKLKESPIIIHSAKIEHDDISFPSLMIQSESGLKSHSAFPITKSQIKNLLKSNSDRKFFPGRISDNSDEQTPFVTFFLTPRQNETAGLTSDQAKIITRERVPDIHKSKELPKEKKDKEIDGEISLANVEKFIEYLSKSRKKGFRESTRRNKLRVGDIKKYTKTAKMAQQMKNIKRARQFLDSIMPTNHNHYPQCEIKKTLIKTKVEIEKERKLLKRKMAEESKKLRLRKEEQKANNLPGGKSVAQTKGSQENSQNKLVEEEKKTTVGESKSNAKSKKEEKSNSPRTQSRNKDFEAQTMSTILESNEKELNSAVGKNSSQEHKTKSEKNYSLRKTNKKYITRSCELLNFVKEVILTVPDTKIKKEVIEVIEDYSKTLQKTLNEKADPNKGKAGPISEKESHEETASNKEAHAITNLDKIKTEKGCKTFTIKIRCNNHGVREGVSSRTMDCTKEARKPFKEKNLRPSLIASPLDPEKVEKEGNINLLDSLVADDSTSKELSRVSSIYFDAFDNFLDAPVAHQKAINDSEPLKTSRRPLAEKFLENNNLQEQSIFAPAAEKSADGTDIDRTYAVSLKQSDILLLSQEPLTNECEEKIFGKIMHYLQTNDVNYAMALVKGLLDKSKTSEKKTDSSSKMKNLLIGIENKSKSVIESMEKKGWLKVLSLIEEVALVFHLENKSFDSVKQETKLVEKILKTQNLMPQVSESLKNLEKQVHKSKTFMHIVKSLSESGPLVSNVTLRERPSYEKLHLCSKEVTTKLDKKEGLLGKKSVGSSTSYVNNMFPPLGKSPMGLKKNYLTKGESEEGYGARNSGITQGLQIHKTLNTLEIPVGISTTSASNADIENALFLNQLKEQIRRQRQYVHYLLNSNSDPVHSEVLEIKKKVAKHLESLENAILQLEATHHTTTTTTTISTTSATSTSKEECGKTSYSSLAATYATCLEESQIFELRSSKSSQLFEHRPEKNGDLESSLNYLVLGGLRSFNKSYSTSFDVGPFLNEDPY